MLLENGEALVAGGASSTGVTAAAELYNCSTGTFSLRVLFLGAFENHFDICFPHGLAQIPMHEETAEPTQSTAQVIERAAQVDIGNVDMPMLMGLQRLLETAPLA